MRQAFIFKVVDSDDWVNEEAYKQILKTLEELTRRTKNTGYADQQFCI